MARPGHLLLVNPSAGAGLALERLPEVESEMRRHGLEYRLAETTGRSDLAALLERLRQSYDNAARQRGARPQRRRHQHPPAHEQSACRDPRSRP